MSTKQRTRRRSNAHDGISRQLSESDILSAALRLIRRDGGEKLSMRTLATELGVTPMAIYHYVPNKAALVQQLGDSVLGGVPTPTPTGTLWASEFKAFALDGWERLAAHPGLSDLLLKQPPSRVQRQLMRYGSSILSAAGFDPHIAGLAITGFNMFMFGVMSTQAQLSRVHASTPAARRDPKAAKVDRIREYLGTLDYRELLEYQLDMVIAGLRARARTDAKTEARADQAPQPARRRVERALKSG